MIHLRHYQKNNEIFLIALNPIFINLALQCVANIGDKEMATAFTQEIPRLLISGLVNDKDFSLKNFR